MEQQNTELKIQQRIEQLKKITRQDSKKKYAGAQFELFEIYYFDKKDWRLAIKYLSNIKQADNPKIYANAQFNLGVIYQFKCNNFEQAKSSFLSVKKQDNPEVYAAAQLNLGIIYQNKQDIEQAEHSYLNVEKQDNPESYAQAQLNLGVIYQKVKHNIEQAEHCYLNVEKQDNPEIYAQAQLNLGVIYEEEKHNIEMAEHCYLKVEKQDNPEVYAQAQLYLGIIYQYEYNNFNRAEQYYLHVEKQDNPELYAQAQLNLGVIYQKVKHNIEQAEHCYLNVEKQDNPEIYAQAQLNLGVIYQTVQHNIEMAEQCYLKVKKQDNPEVYAAAQLHLGFIYQNEKYNIKMAEYYYLNVKKEDNPKAYAQAQLYLGVIYQNREDIEQANDYYLSIKKQDNPEAYAAAQFHLGFIYQYEYNNLNRAEEYYLNIEKQDNSAAYAAAQFNLGVIYQNREDINDAENCYSNIKQQDNPEAYAAAQLKLGVIYQNREDIEQANDCYLNVEKENDLDVYNDVQRELGDNVFFKLTEKKLKSADEYYQNVAYSDDSFESYIIAQIMLFVINNKNVPKFRDKEDRNNLVINPICEIRKYTHDIQDELFVTFRLNKKLKTQKKQFERQVAHYTKPEVLFNLLKNKNKPSDFRLNVIDFMNDPTENQVLTDWLGVNTENNNDIKTFLASFSFNHNSLNQFRLYGNENNIVGSSVSVVFNQKFFSKNIKRIINSEGINSLFKYENLNQNNDKAGNDLNENSVQKNSETVAKKNITSSVGLLPLFRCLYFDPKNGYISIAKRNKFSFYLEHQNNSHKGIDAKWNGYLKQLKEKEKIATIREKLNQIQDIICRLKKSRKVKKITNLDQLIALALMPISCLVKHAAFEDEDECRMIYITNIADELIQAPTNYAYANSLFVNYGKIEDYLEKIYLGPQCQPHHKLWITNHVRTSQSKTRSNSIKVVQSEMPLR